MKGIFSVVLVFCLALPFAAKAADYNTADFDSQFSDAALVRGSEAVKGTDLLVRDITSVLHKEHMALLEEITKLEGQIADLKKDVKDIKDQVESGQ